VAGEADVSPPDAPRYGAHPTPSRRGWWWRCRACGRRATESTRSAEVAHLCPSSGALVRFYRPRDVSPWWLAWRLTAGRDRPTSYHRIEAHQVHLDDRDQPRPRDSERTACGLVIPDLATVAWCDWLREPPAGQACRRCGGEP
jgi:hypothetical protein